MDPDGHYPQPAQVASGSAEPRLRRGKEEPVKADSQPGPSPANSGRDQLNLSLPKDLEGKGLLRDGICDRLLGQYGVVKPTKKLPWRHRWPDAVRDEVLARLLALNAERYTEEQARGLRGKGAKKGAGGGGKRKPVSAATKSDHYNTKAEQMGLKL